MRSATIHSTFYASTKLLLEESAATDGVKDDQDNLHMWQYFVQCQKGFSSLPP
jgi:hypothetical protein